MSQGRSAFLVALAAALIVPTAAQAKPAKPVKQSPYPVLDSVPVDG
jgi:hypothetical protein